jgi:hypothetical protein
VREEHVVVAEDDVVLAAELTEEGRPGDPGGLRDLLDRGRFEPLRGEQVQRSGDDGVAGGGGRRFGHAREPNATGACMTLRGRATAGPVRCVY